MRIPFSRFLLRSSVQGGLMWSERKHSLSTEPVPVSACVLSSKNLKNLKRAREREGRTLRPRVGRESCSRTCTCRPRLLPGGAAGTLHGGTAKAGPSPSFCPHNLHRDENMLPAFRQSWYPRRKAREREETGEDRGIRKGACLRRSRGSTRSRGRPARAPAPARPSVPRSPPPGLELGV